MTSFSRIVIEKTTYRKSPDRSPRLLSVQFALTPGLYPGPGVYPGPGFYPGIYGNLGHNLRWHPIPVFEDAYRCRSARTSHFFSHQQLVTGVNKDILPTLRLRVVYTEDTLTSPCCIVHLIVRQHGQWMAA